MIRLNRLFLSLLFILTVTNIKVSGQVTLPVSVTGHVIAEIIPVFSASETSQLNFGRFAPGLQGGQIILSPESTVSLLGSVFQGAGTYNAASFFISGDVNAVFSVSLPSGPVVLTHTSSARNMLVRDWVSIPYTGTGTGVLQNGFQVVYVGATLIVGTLSDNPTGIYTGTYTITFDFN